MPANANTRSLYAIRTSTLLLKKWKNQFCILFYHLWQKQQLQQSDVDINLLYYLWFDEQAGQLRFNFINSNHDKLPFRCKLVFVDSEKEIIDDFLNSNYLDGIPWSEFKVVDKTKQENVAAVEEENLETFTLKVYKQMIYRNE